MGEVSLLDFRVDDEYIIVPRVLLQFAVCLGVISYQSATH